MIILLQCLSHHVRSTVLLLPKHATGSEIGTLVVYLLLAHHRAVRVFGYQVVDSAYHATFLVLNRRVRHVWRAQVHHVSGARFALQPTPIVEVAHEGNVYSLGWGGITCCCCCAHGWGLHVLSLRCRLELVTHDEVRWQDRRSEKRLVAGLICFEFRDRVLGD